MMNTMGDLENVTEVLLAKSVVVDWCLGGSEYFVFC